VPDTDAHLQMEQKAVRFSQMTKSQMSLSTGNLSLEKGRE